MEDKITKRTQTSRESGDGKKSLVSCPLNVHLTTSYFYKIVNISIFIVFLILSTFCHAESNINTYDKYINVRFNYSVIYPNNIFIKYVESDNGDGRVFYTNDTDYFIVSAINNSAEESIRDFYVRNIKLHIGNNKKIKYKNINNNYFEIISTCNNKFYYQKTIYKNDVFVTLVIVYDKIRKIKFSGIVDKMSKSIQFIYSK